MSRDGSVLTVAHASNVTFLNADTLCKIKDVSVPTTVNSASLHPDKTIFVAGGDDLKVYKFDYTTGNEIGKRINVLTRATDEILNSCIVRKLQSE